VWLEDVSFDWALERVSTAPPAGEFEFDAYEAEGLTIWLEHDREWSDGLRLMLSPWAPFDLMAIPAGGEGAVVRRVAPRGGRFTV